MRQFLKGLTEQSYTITSMQQEKKSLRDNIRYSLHCDNNKNCMHPQEGKDFPPQLKIKITTSSISFMFPISAHQSYNCFKQMELLFLNSARFIGEKRTAIKSRGTNDDASEWKCYLEQKFTAFFLLKFKCAQSQIVATQIRRQQSTESNVYLLSCVCFRNNSVAYIACWGRRKKKCYT